MTRLRPLIAALDRIATALEQLAPALTQATREQHQIRQPPHPLMDRLPDAEPREFFQRAYTPPNRPADPPPRPPGRSQG